MTRPDTAAGRAARLLRWYPRSWRERYGAEFTELLISDISERPRSTARTLDVARSGIVARLAGAGLGGCPTGIEASRQVRASLGSLGCALAVFLAIGAAQHARHISFASSRQARLSLHPMLRTLRSPVITRCE